MDRLNSSELVLPLIPLREMVIFPSVIIPILIGRQKSVLALKDALHHYNQHVLLATQKNQGNEAPENAEIYEVGTVAKIEKYIEQNNGSYRVIVQGLRRARIAEFIPHEHYFLVKTQLLTDIQEEDKNLVDLAKNLIVLFEEYIQYKNVRLPGVSSRLKPDRLGDVADIVVSILNVPLPIKQLLLEEANVYLRGVKVFNILKKEILRLRSQKEQDVRTRKDDGQEGEYSEYRKKVTEANLPEYVQKRALEELERLAAMPPYSAESTVSRYYLDWLLDIPWKVFQRESHSLQKAKRILAEDHYGLQKVKERILDYLAVRQLVHKPLGEIICFVGPPGVGKSSLSRSIARALDRKFVRVSLGGVKDEAEIRGHRRTYIGSYPGQIIKGLKKAGCMNPVFLLDEIDKLGSDFRGDPASALLEALDPDQNNEFVDHYLDLEVDLSQVFFITTANVVEPIPPALHDRMEVIELPGYTEREKLEIAKQFLIKKQAKRNGLDPEQVCLPDDILLRIINEYTREAGVRNLEREIGVIMRKIARNTVELGSKKKDKNKVVLDEALLQQYLGIAKFNPQKIQNSNEVGVALGLAWTSTGGDILVVEARRLKGKGELILTGRMGEVMKESSSAAFSYTKLKLFELEFDQDDLKNYDIHLHIPEGAVPKEGPSAGVTLAVSMISLLTGIAVKANFAMTGEITLRGKILPVGGIKEKIIAAHRYGIRHVLIPLENKKDFQEDIPEEVRQDVRLYPVDNMDELLDIVLEKPLQKNSLPDSLDKAVLGPNIQ